MPRELGAPRRAEVRGKPCDAPVVGDDAACPPPEALSIRECIRFRAFLGERERRDQPHQLLDHRRDAPPARLRLVPRDHVRPRLERQEQLAEPRRLRYRAPEAPPEPRHPEPRGRVGERLVRDQHRVAREHALLEPEPLALRERREVLEQRPDGLAIIDDEDPPERGPARPRLAAAGGAPPSGLPTAPRASPDPPAPPPAGTHLNASTARMRHGAHAPPTNAGSAAPPPASTTAAGFPACTAQRTVNTDPRDGPQRNATTPDDARASRRERPSSAARPTPAPGTTRPPCAAKAPSDCARAAPEVPGRNTTERAHAGRPAATTASNAHRSAPRAPPEPMAQPRATKHPTTSATCAAHPPRHSPH